MEARHVPINIEDEIRKSYLEYALSVIIGRALPDVRDGLKPVHRRILYAMGEAGNDYNRPYRKSARIVGDVIGKYHPHGDVAVYDAVVRMAQDFSLRYPLVDGQGNFGIDRRRRPAAMRYTEVRLSRLAHELLQDLEKETVDFVANYDGSMQEPLVLPTRLPNLLVNGASGIAVGMATNIPPHNLDEVCEALLAYLDNPEITLPELMAFIPGPDFPTGGYIYGAEGIAEAYGTGKGLIRIRAKVIVEHKGGRETLVVRELPYQVNKARLIERIAEMVKDKKLEGISEIRDESDREGMRVVIQLKKDESHQTILNQLFLHTQMQVTFGINLVAIVENRPELLNLRDMLRHFLAHRREVILRRTRYELKQAEARAHILAGLLIALDHLDEVIDLIRAAPDAATAKEQLIARFALDDIQAQAILDMRLARLTGLERQKIVDEAQELAAAIARYPPHPQRGGPGQGPYRRGTQGTQGEIRGQPPDRDHPGSPGLHRRGPHRRRRDGSDHQPPELHQAHPLEHLPQPAPGRQGAHRHAHPGKRLCLPALCRHHAQLLPGLHQHRPGVLDQGP